MIQIDYYNKKIISKFYTIINNNKNNKIISINLTASVST